MPFSLLDFIFPKKCVSCGKLGDYICKDCFLKVEFIEMPVCPMCQRQAIGGKTHPGCYRPLGLDGLVVGCRYRGPVREAIKSVKYRWQYDIAKTLVSFLISNYWRFNLEGDFVMVPVPLHTSRKKWRGFNQAEKLCEILSNQFLQEYDNFLKRILNTKTQVGLSKEDRKKNIKGAFGVLDKEAVKGKNILLVDDVYTSGATMAECCKVIKRAGAKSVWGMVVALG